MCLILILSHCVKPLVDFFFFTSPSTSQACPHCYKVFKRK